LWISGVVGSVLFLAVGSWSIIEAALGSDVHAAVRTCSTIFHLFGRFVDSETTCDVTLDADGPGMPRKVYMARNYKSEDGVVVTAFRHTLSDPELLDEYAWLLPVGLAGMGATWWMGLPPRKAPTVGRHRGAGERG
jgi:hypothetical protein